MDYEKAYKEALERAKEEQETFINLGNISGKSAIERIFPVLYESEDEKIRKSLITLIKEIKLQPLKRLENWDGMLAWLEKQREQKPVEQDTETNDLWVYIREWNDKFGRLPKDEDELASCIDYVMKRQKPADNYCQENCKGYRDTGGKCFADGECEAKKKAEQNHSWSEEDELMFTSTINSLKLTNGACYMKIDWLKSLKDRITSPKKR
jgi:hypothetical protein